jgi:photosystem II stability/assembly factor-like uncharacterized protein
LLIRYQKFLSLQKLQIIQRSIMKFFLIFCITIFLFSTSDAQYTWVMKRSGSSLGNPIAVDKYNADIMYFGTGSIIYKSTDRGETFSQYGTTIPGSSNIKAVILSAYDDNTMLVATTNKIVKSTDSGATWSDKATGLNFAYFGIPMTVDHANPDTIYTMNGSIFMVSTDFGDTWVNVTTTVGFGSPCDIEVFPDSSNIILVGDNGTGIFRSTNYGQTWANVYSTSGEIPTIAVDKNNAGVAWATKWGGGGGFLKTTNYGATWTALPFFNSKNMWGVDVSPHLSDYVMTATYSGGSVYMSKDQGLTWTTLSISSSNYSIFIVDTMTVFAAQGSGLFKLTSPYYVPVEFTSFTVKSAGEEVVLSWSTATETNNKGFEIERSSDDIEFETAGFVNGAGTISEPQNYSYKVKNNASGKTYFRIKQIDYDGTFTYTQSLEVDGYIPAEYNVYQNYPNPFNPSTKISFAVPVDAEVTVKVFNTIGQEVGSLISGYYAAGIHNVDFNAGRLSSGIYFYSVEAKGTDGTSFVKIRKMTLLK